MCQDHKYKEPCPLNGSPVCSGRTPQRSTFELTAEHKKKNSMDQSFIYFKISFFKFLSILNQSKNSENKKTVKKSVKK